VTPEGVDSSGLPFALDIAIQDNAWGDVFENPDPICARAIHAAVTVIDTPEIGELSVAFVDDAAIQVLNNNFRETNKPTNVLSFPSTGPAPILGDIVLARETILREAADKNIPPINHVTHLLIHGFLHLQGYDHGTDEDATIMEALEIAALQRLGIDNPYQIKEFSN